MEYLWRGDLLGYLRKSRGVFDQYHHGVGGVDHLTTYDMVLFAKQIAHGMTFLASRGVSAQTLSGQHVVLHVIKWHDLQIVNESNTPYGYKYPAH